MPAISAAPATTIVMPGDPGWDDARRAWNLAVDQHPAAVALPASAQDVAEAVASPARAACGSPPRAPATTPARSARSRTPSWSS